MSIAGEQEWLLNSCGPAVREFFAAIGLDLVAPPGAVEAPVRCFANPSAHSHEDKNASCSVNLASGLWKCHGCGENGNPYRAAQLLGRTDAEAARLARDHGLFLSLEKAQKPNLPSERKLKQWRHALRDYPALVLRLQELRGWSPWAMCRLGLGWDGERVTFPVRDAKRKIVGVVRYRPGGEPKMKALPGSKRDLFPAPEMIRKHRPLFVVEGECDAVAVWSLGFRCTAIPGAGSWKREWAMRLMGRQVVVLADCDQHGRGLAAQIKADVPDVRVVDLELGRSDGCDIGDWVRDASREGGLGQLSRVLERLAA